MEKRTIFTPFKSKFSHAFGDANAIEGKEILTKLLTTVYKMDQTAIDEILKEGATPETVFAAITKADSTRIKTIKEAAEKDSYQKGYSKSKGESLTAAEQALKDHYGIQSDKTGQELVEEIVSAKLKEKGATTEDEIKGSSTYQQMEQKLRKDITQAKTDAETKIKEMETGWKKEKTFEAVGKKAMDLRNGLNPILPKNATVAATQDADFLNELRQYDYEDKDGNILVYKDGKLREDAHGNTLSYDEHVKEIAAKRWEFAANNGGANGGNGGQGGNGGNGGAAGAGTYPASVTKRPTNATELAQVLNNSGLDTTAKRQVMDVYKKEHGGGAS